ncbi:MAG: hypothetical protein WAN43_14310 [Rhodomicrobium sp.]
MISENRLPLWIFAACAAYALFLFAPQVLNDGDTYLHIAAGEWILQHGSAPGADPFSYTVQGSPWVAHEWLSEAVMALAYRSGGWNGLSILFGLTAAIAFGLFARHLSRWLPPLPATAVSILGGSCAAGSLLARPHILVLPILEVWTAGLLIAREQGRAPWALLPLATLWANMHGSFVFGLALICPFALEAILAGESAWQKPLREWGAFAALAVLATLLTPHGWHGLVFPFQLLSMRSLDRIGEWQSPSFQILSPLEITLLAALAISLSRGVRVPLLRLPILLGLLHLALHHARHALLFGIVGSLVFAEPLARGLGVSPKTAQTATKAPASPLFRVAAAALCAALTLLRFADPATNPDKPASPGSAFAHVPPELAALPVLNDYEFGAFLIFNGVRPYVDSRADLYGDAFLAEYSIMMAPDRALLQKTIDKFKIRWAILRANSPVVGVLESLPGWRRRFGDGIAVVLSNGEAP